MLLQTHFEIGGNWLFRRRSYLPLFILGLFMLAMHRYTHPGNSEWIETLWEGCCLLVSFFGLGIRIFTIGYTPKNTSGRNTKKHYERIIFAEETFLTEKFGQAYIQWATKTPVIVPNFRLYKKAALPFSVKNVLRREYNGVFAVIVCLFALEAVGDMFLSNTVWIGIDPEWKVLLVFGFLAWCILRALKKYTKILNVEGR